MAAQSAGNDSFEIALKCDTKNILEPQFTNCTYISTEELSKHKKQIYTTSSVEDNQN